MVPTNNLFPVFDRAVSRVDKEARLSQRARVIWLYGLSGSGKSTLAIALERRLLAEGFTAHLLDGDNVRTGLNRDLGFSEADRIENIRRVAEVAKLFNQAGVIVIASFITPFRSQREAVRSVVGTDDFLEVYIHASYETCAKRDPKGLYAKAAAGGVQQFTGRDSPFERPVADGGVLVIETENTDPAGALEQLHAAVLPRLKFP